MDDLRFPIGQFEAPEHITLDQISEWIGDIENFPAQLQELTNGQTYVNLSKAYRTDGWTAAQVIHHCADSHMNSLIRFKLALTEDLPTIRLYYEDRWAELAGYGPDLVPNSLALLKHLHHTWVILLRSLNDEDLRREFIHPEQGAENNGSQKHRHLCMALPSSLGACKLP